MLAIKGYYKDGRIDLVEPVPPDIGEAELHIVIIPKAQSGQHHIPLDGFRITPGDSLTDFKMLGFLNFFDDDDDNDVDWEDHSYLGR
jgi:hypothetical protein